MNQPMLHLPHAPAPRTGQATEIEKSRAGAEVFYSVLAAKQSPRDEDYARGAMQRACSMKRLAERAFFRLSRSGSAITGPSVHLARELARCWGNVQYGLIELRRDDTAGESELQAFAWDLETNTRSTHTFIVPHTRDVKVNGERRRRPLESAQDVYENNANAGARRVREAIFGVLPDWFVEEAQEICRATIERGDGTPLAQRVKDAIAAFAEFKVTEAQLVAKLERPASKWTASDIAHLTTIYNSLKHKEIDKDQEFPATAEGKVTAAELVGGKK